MNQSMWKGKNQIDITENHINQSCATQDKSQFLNSNMEFQNPSTVFNKLQQDSTKNVDNNQNNFSEFMSNFFKHLKQYLGYAPHQQNKNQFTDSQLFQSYEVFQSQTIGQQQKQKLVPSLQTNFQNDERLGTAQFNFLNSPQSEEVLSERPTKPFGDNTFGIQQEDNIKIRSLSNIYQDHQQQKQQNIISRNKFSIIVLYSLIVTGLLFRQIYIGNIQCPQTDINQPTQISPQPLQKQLLHNSACQKQNQELTQLNTQNNNLILENKKCSQQLESIENNYKKSVDESQNIQKNYAALEETCKKTTNDLKSTRQDNENLQSQIKGVQNQQTICETNNENFKADQTILQKKITDQQSDFTALQTSYNQLEKKNQQCQQRNGKYKKQSVSEQQQIQNDKQTLEQNANCNQNLLYCQKQQETQSLQCGVLNNTLQSVTKENDQLKQIYHQCQDNQKKLQTSINDKQTLQQQYESCQSLLNNNGKDCEKQLSIQQKSIKEMQNKVGSLQSELKQCQSAEDETNEQEEDEQSQNRIVFVVMILTMFCCFGGYVKQKYAK